MDISKCFMKVVHVRRRRFVERWKTREKSKVVWAGTHIKSGIFARDWAILGNLAWEKGLVAIRNSGKHSTE